MEEIEQNPRPAQRDFDKKFLEQEKDKLLSRAEEIKSSVSAVALPEKANHKAMIDYVKENSLYESKEKVIQEESKYEGQIRKMVNGIKFYDNDMVSLMCKQEVANPANGNEIRGEYQELIDKAQNNAKTKIRECYGQQFGSREDELRHEAIKQIRQGGGSLDFDEIGRVMQHHQPKMEAKKEEILKEEKTMLENGELTPERIRFTISGVDENTTAEQIVQKRVNQAVQKVSNSSKISQEEEITLGRLSPPTTPRIKGQGLSSDLGM